jgi:D-aspartate ligase
VLRSLGRNGLPAFVAGDRIALVGSSRWYRPVPGESIEETDDGERLARYLQTLPFERAVLFPCSDRWAMTMASLPAGMARSYPAVVAPPEVIRVLVDKAGFARAAEEHDVPVPRTVHVTRAEELDGFAEAELRDFFLKPRDSQSFIQRRGVKGLRLTGRAHAGELVHELAADGLEVLLQEFIPGPATAHIFLDGYVDRSGEMRACLARRRLRMYPLEFGNSTLSVTMPLAEAGQALDSLRRLFDGLSFVGLFDAEFKYDARDGRFKLLEVNGRPWWQLELAAACGLDVTLLAYRDALGLDLPPAGGYRVGVTWVHPLPDLRAWRAARANGAVAGGFPLKSWFGGGNALFSRDDPMPAKEELARVARRLVGAVRRRAGSG